MITLAKRAVPEDSVTLYGICASLGVVGLVLAFQVSFGFLLDTLLAIVVLLFVWLPVNLLLDAFSMEMFSPISLNRALPVLLREPWSEETASTNANPATGEPSLDSVGSWMDRFSAAFFVPETHNDPKFFRPEGSNGFSLPSVALGYAAATLLSIGVATAVFCLRDL